MGVARVATCEARRVSAVKTMALASVDKKCLCICHDDDTVCEDNLYTG